MMQSSKNDKVKILCPQCNHYIVGEVKEDSSIVSRCKHCKSVIYTKEHHKRKEKLIRIVKFS